MQAMSKKRLSGALALLVACSALIPGAAFGADSSAEPAPKERPFPSSSGQFRAFAEPPLFIENNIGNAFVQAQVDNTGRFNAALKHTESEGWFNIVYNWPSNPGTSFTSLKIDGQEMVYGDWSTGEFLAPPANNESLTANDSVWKTGDVTVRQVLSAGVNPATGLPDALQIRYVITNTGETEHEVGLRLLIDTMVAGNDAAPFKVPGASGVESVNYERDYVGSDVPAFWQVFNDFNIPGYSAQYSMEGRDATTPDRFTIANWSTMDDTLWDYSISEGRETGDSAVGMWWNPDTLAPGEQRIITTYYGRPGVGGESSLVLSGRKSLSYDEWQTNPFKLISYLSNSTAEALDHVRLQIEPDAGLVLDGTAAEQAVGQVEPGQTVQTDWKLKASVAGTYGVTVRAFEDGATEPFATAEYEVEALAPVVPPNVSIGGGQGTTSDGTPVAGRVSPLTISASFDSPQASGVSLRVSDADGDVYEAELTSDNGTDWSHTFTPSQVGLWEAPLSVAITPRYPDNTTGPVLEFPITLIDPSGFIYNEAKGTDWKLPGATVTLQYRDPLLNTWVNMNEEAYPGQFMPVTNPQVTGADGRYGWDAAAGSYRVVVSRPGFATATSRVVDIPPPVTDLDVGLTPTDTGAPAVTLIGVQSGQSYTGAVEASFTAVDDAAGVRQVSYSIDGDAAVVVSDDEGTLPAISGSGQHTIELTATDHAGNEKSVSLSFAIKDTDQTAPVTVLLANDAPAAEWYRANAIEVKLSASDEPSGSGVAGTYYKVNGGTEKPYAGPFSLSGSSSYHIAYYSRDNAGNAENAKTVTLKVDTAAPTTTYKVTPVWATKGGVKYIKGYTWTLAAKDAASGSGVKHTYYRVNGGAWNAYTSPFEAAASTNNLSIEFYSMDHAGNKETVK
ncbi:OmpL47-type beta-barrel domain-containing protein [Paenibacillus xanthanilyticus]|uniref:OmpL47-type beta-barrel domain-containing protein n=1 Tax=Paenibacillus xanthanilyticus TaxID=1783531 RepID=A0ABV8K5G0_9BACL